MNNKLTNTLKVVALTLPLGLAACATSGDMEAMSARVDRAQATADEALSKANAAQTTADQASANSMQAVQTANDAKATADATDEKLNRAFSKSMEK